MVKYPPIEKIYEAWSAIADGRVSITEKQATILSSDRTKEYTVSWEGTSYSSTDNATHWQGYAGYPVLAVLMLQKRLPLDTDIAALFVGINWTKANATAKRDYAKAVDTVLANFGLDQNKIAAIRAEAAHVLDSLKALDVHIKRSSAKAKKMP